MTSCWTLGPGQAKITTKISLDVATWHNRCDYSMKKSGLYFFILSASVIMEQTEVMLTVVAPSEIDELFSFHRAIEQINTASLALAWAGEIYI